MWAQSRLGPNEHFIILTTFMDSILLGFSLQSLQKLTTEYGQQCCCLGVIDHVQETAIQWQRFSMTILSHCRMITRLWVCGMKGYERGALCSQQGRQSLNRKCLCSRASAITDGKNYSFGIKYANASKFSVEFSKEDC